jgi:hypothetical protein
VLGNYNFFQGFLEHLRKGFPSALRSPQNALAGLLA